MSAMSTLQTLYPALLAALNVATGWTLYGPLESAFGISFLGVGLLIVVTVLGRTVGQRIKAPNYFTTS